MNEKICIFDVETTGTSAENDQIIELCIQPSLGEPSAAHTWRFKPEVPISPGAQRIHGITMEDLRDCPPFSAHADEVRDRLRSADILVGYNLAFDLDFVQAEFRRLRHEPIDVSEKLLVDPLQLWRRFEPRNLAAAHEKFAGEPMDGAHSASCDVAATGRVLQGMIQAFGLAENSWTEIAELCPIHSARKKWIGPSSHFIWQGSAAVFGFGKHRMRTIIEVAQEDNGSYIQWIVSKDFPSHVKEIAKAAIEQPPEEFLSWLAKEFK